MVLVEDDVPFCAVEHRWIGQWEATSLQRTPPQEMGVSTLLVTVFTRGSRGDENRPGLVQR